jgi:hypothetical protein
MLFPLLFIAGCNSYDLRYKAAPQPSNANLFVGYSLLQDSVGIMIDTDGRRLEEAFIRLPDGSVVRPVNVVFPSFGKSASIGAGVGVGWGGVGVGTGVGVPVGPERAYGLTTATFTSSSIGAAPWELHVKVHDVHEAVIPAIGGPPTAK